MNYNGLSLMSLFYHGNREKSSFSSELSFHNCTYLWKFLTLFLINMTVSNAPLLLCSIMTKCLLPTSCKPDFYFNFLYLHTKTSLAKRIPTVLCVIQRHREKYHHRVHSIPYALFLTGMFDITWS